MRILHLSDIHIWRLDFRPWRLAGKRAVGMTHLVTGRAARFRLERLDGVIEYARQLRPDHVLITGDLTTTALVEEFRAARTALAPLLGAAPGATVIPGNHDRYTVESVTSARFEAYFGEFAAEPAYPWLRWLDDRTAILAIDATRAHYSARGHLPTPQLERARDLARQLPPGTRVIVASHYPLEAPLAYRGELFKKRLANVHAAIDWLAGIGPHLYCCGHVHAAWAFRPGTLPRQLCINAGAPLLHDPTGQRPPGFVEIELVDAAVDVTHHAWSGSAWVAIPLVRDLRLFD